MNILEWLNKVIFAPFFSFFDGLPKEFLAILVPVLSFLGILGIKRAVSK